MKPSMSTKKYPDKYFNIEDEETSGGLFKKYRSKINILTGNVSGVGEYIAANIYVIDIAFGRLSGLVCQNGTKMGCRYWTRYSNGAFRNEEDGKNGF